MTQEDKELLLKDLCSRLPYGVKVQYENNIFDIDYISPMYEEVKLNIADNYTIGVYEIKPYLFPLSSMTEEQLFEVRQILGKDWEIEKDFIHLNTAYVVSRTLSYLELQALFEWFNKNHIDYRGLIPKGLAIDCTGLNIY